MKKLLALSFLLASLSSISSAIAEEIVIVTEDSPAESEKVGDHGITGIGGDVVTEALKAKKISFKMLWLPWKRAQQETQDNIGKNKFILPLTRNKEREESYVWVGKLYDSSTAFISLKKNKAVNNYKEANGVKLGVLLGSSYESSLMSVQNGIFKSEIDSVPSEETNAKKLESGKIGAWYTGTIGAFSIFKNLKIDGSQFQTGSPIEVEENYLATGKTTDAALVNKIRAAIDEFRKLPAYEKIVAKYTKGG